jgi:hypothetical protein
MKFESKSDLVVAAMGLFIFVARNMFPEVVLMGVMVVKGAM